MRSVGYIRAILTLSGFLLLFSSPARAQLSTNCSSPNFIIPDGRVTEYTIPASTTAWFAFSSTSGHSYTAEGNYAEDPGVNPTVLAFKSADLNFTTCAGTSTLGAIDTFGVDPDAQDGDRASFTVSAVPLNPTIYVSVQNIEAVTHRLTFLVSETTLFNPLWSTFGGFNTFYRFQNTTKATLHVTLTLINDAGTTVATITALAIAAGATAPTRNTGSTDLNVAASQAGHGIITHDGPPGALQVDGFLGNFSGGSVVLPIKIVGARTRL